MAQGSLAAYNRRRNFKVTPEPPGKAGARRSAGRFVVQKHAASHLHYDFRLEWESVLRSWAVPRGPSLDPAVKRMAVQVEDHPLSYGDFEGVIPAGHYGAGSVVLWDRGRWTPVGDAAKGLREGRLKFRLEGEKLNGGFMLVRLRPRGRERQPSWLLIKEKDEYARPEQAFDVLAEMPGSVKRPVDRARGKRPSATAGSRGPRRARKAAGARRARRAGGGSLPPLLAPQLATLVSAPPPRGEWLYELKLDGYRLLARIDGDDVRCFTRNGNDWSARVPRVVAALKSLQLPPCWLDGELVALDQGGVPDFQRLQNAFEHHEAAELRYLVFDLLFVDGEDLRDQSQRERTARLSALLADVPATSIVQQSPGVEGRPAELLAASREAGFEGLVGKRADAPYRAGRSRDWIKLKAGLRQEFVIGGFTDPQGSRAGFGSLLLGVYDEDGALRYAGNVGSGFDEATLRSLHAKLSAIGTADSPFRDGPVRVGTTRRVVPHWVKPKLVAEVSFAGWTQGSHVRQAVFRGLREDKPARQIVRERPVQPAGQGTEAGVKKRRVAGKASAAGGARARASKAGSATARAARSPRKVATSGLRITHAERVIDAENNITKGDLVAYYAMVGRLMLPHLADRPVALLRAPQGVTGQKFFQKHADEGSLPGVERLPPELDPEHRPLLVVPTARALVQVAQMNVVELHTWNATRHAIEQPDRLIFDLDPGEGVGWKEVVEGALLVRALLEQLRLRSFVKTSGGSGLHIVLPLKPQLGWDEAKEFSAQVVRHMARVLPQRFVAKSGPKNRVGRIFADYLRNGRGATTVAAWSARARPGMSISVPLWWDELEELGARPRWNVLDPGDRVDIGNRPWKDYERSRQSLGGAIEALAGVEASPPRAARTAPRSRSRPGRRG
jgi:bifunctional non-homologous end joining protein LigD